MSVHSPRPTFEGDRQELIIAIDIGTTYSGVSYAFLESGVAPKITHVVGFRGQENQSSSTKVPSVVFYDKAGRVCAIGAETNDPEIVTKAEEEKWIRIAWFKLLLRPREKNSHLDEAPCPELPSGKSIENVIGDFLKYMNDCAKSYNEEKFVTGKSMWGKVEGRITYILGHPNGWHGFQQEKMRDAAILGGLIPDTDSGRSRIRFVTEGEASFHWCVDTGLASDSLQEGKNIVVADAGGGTIDVSAFRVTRENPLQLEETRPSESRLAGSIFITDGFEKFTRALLKGSDYDDAETFRRLADDFDKKAKCLFREDTRVSTVTIAGPRVNDDKLRIKGGRLTLKREDMIPLFEKSCQAMAEAIRVQVAGNDHTAVYIVGGFAASSYLFAEVKERLKDLNVTIRRSDSNTAKAVAHGAVSFYLDRYISARVAKHTYGVTHGTEFDPEVPSHLERKDKIHINPLFGRIMLLGAFTAHVRKGTVVKETSVTRIPLSRIIGPGPTSEEVELELFAYKGNVEDISWFDQDPDGFYKACTFKATIPADCMTGRVAPIGIVYWTAQFEAVVSFGTTDFQCHLEWKDKKGAVKRGPVSLVWNEG